MQPLLSFSSIVLLLILLILNFLFLSYHLHDQKIKGINNLLCNQPVMIFEWSRFQRMSEEDDLLIAGSELCRLVRLRLFDWFLFDRCEGSAGQKADGPLGGG